MSGTVLLSDLTVLQPFVVRILVSCLSQNHLREDIVQNGIREIGDRCDAKVTGHIGLQAIHKVLGLAKRASNFGHVSSVKKAAAFELTISLQYQ